MKNKKQTEMGKYVMKDVRAMTIVACIAVVAATVTPRAVSAAEFSIEVGSGWHQFFFCRDGFEDLAELLNASTPDEPTVLSFTADEPRTVVSVTDVDVRGDSFDLFDSGFSLGSTSEPGTGNTSSNPDIALADPLASSGQFSVGPGPNTIQIFGSVVAPFACGGAYFRVDARRTRIDLVGDGGDGSADWRARAKGFRLNVDVEDVDRPDGTVLNVAACGYLVGEITLTGGRGELSLDADDDDFVPGCPGFTDSGVLVSDVNGVPIVSGEF